LYDARHTAATVLLVLKVPLVAVMDLMGWSDAAVAKRYMHVTDEVVTAVAAQVGSHMWAEPESEEEADDQQLTDEQHQPSARSSRRCLRCRCTCGRSLKRLLLRSDDDGSAGAPVLA
jgi:hypothetical protein